MSHILGLGVCTVVGVTGRHALRDAKSGVDRLFVSLASMYLTIKIYINPIIIQAFHVSSFLLLVRARPPPTVRLFPSNTRLRAITPSLSPNRCLPFPSDVLGRNLGDRAPGFPILQLGAPVDAVDDVGIAPELGRHMYATYVIGKRTRLRRPLGRRVE